MTRKALVLLAACCFVASPVLSQTPTAGPLPSPVQQQESQDPQLEAERQISQLLGEGNESEAERIARDHLREAEAATGPESIETLNALDLLVYALLRSKSSDSNEAMQLAERLLELTRTVRGPGHPKEADALNSLGYLLWREGKLAEAVSAHERAVAIAGKSPEDRALLARSLSFLGTCLRESDQLTRARKVLERSVAIWEELDGVDGHRAATTLQRGIFEKLPGSRIWWVRYVDAHGCYRREKAGTKTTALVLYRKRKTEALEGRKLPELRRRVVTFSELAEDALAYGRQHKRSHQDDMWRMARCLVWWKDKPAESITPSEIEQRLFEQAWAPATVNRYRALLSFTFNLGIRHGKVSTNPARQIPRLPERNVRQGFVDDAQYIQLAQACDSLWLRALLALAYTYGWRKGELLSLRVRQVNLLERTIRLEPGTTKNEEGRTVKLTGETYELVKACVEGKQPDYYVFTHEDGSRVRDFRGAWLRLCQQTGIPGLLFHDLRRSAVRNLERAGVPRSVATKITGHKTESVYRRYAIVSEADLAEATRKLEQAKVGTDTTIAPATGTVTARSANIV